MFASLKRLILTVTTENIPTWAALGNSDKKKLPFNKKKPQNQAQSGRTSASTGWGREEREGHWKSTLKWDAPGLESVIQTSTGPDYLWDEKSTDNSGEEV